MEFDLKRHSQQNADSLDVNVEGHLHSGADEVRMDSNLLTAGPERVKGGGLHQRPGGVNMNRRLGTGRGAAGGRAYTAAVALAHEGNESRPKMTQPQLLTARQMQPIPMTFITTPDLACRGRTGGGGCVVPAQLAAFSYSTFWYQWTRGTRTCSI